MPAPLPSPAEQAVIDRFEVAPAAPESWDANAAVRAGLALADELEGYTTQRGRPAPGSYDYGVNLAQADAANLIRERLGAPLAGQPTTDEEGQGR